MGVEGLLSPPQGHPLQRDIPGVGVKGQDWWARPPRGSQAALLASTHSTRAARRVYGTICLTKHRCLFKEKKKHSWTLFSSSSSSSAWGLGRGKGVSCLEW